MADISKCCGEGCPIKERCYRFTAPTNPDSQSVISPPGEYQINGFICTMFYDNIRAVTDYILDESRPGQICLSRDYYRKGDVVQIEGGNLTIKSLSKVMGALCFYNLDDKHAFFPPHLVGTKVKVILKT